MRLPLFPLSAVLFPDMIMPLHIFEPRYRILVRRCLDRGDPFGIVLLREGREVGPSASPHQIGTTARIVGHSPLPDGRSYILVRGERRFAIEKVDREAEPFLVGEVRFLDEDEGADAREVADIAAEAYGQYLLALVATTGQTRAEVPATAELAEGSPRQVSYRIAAGLAVDPAERQRLLAASLVADRLGAELHILDREGRLLRDLLVRLRVRGEGPPLH